MEYNPAKVVNLFWHTKWVQRGRWSAATLQYNQLTTIWLKIVGSISTNDECFEYKAAASDMRLRQLHQQTILTMQVAVLLCTTMMVLAH